MISIRPFNNKDVTAIVSIWNRCAPVSQGRLRSMSLELLEEDVLGLPLFDPRALLIAWDETNRPIGFVHAAFGANRSGDGIDKKTGIICMLQVVPDCPAPAQVRRELLHEAERYLENHGAKTIYAGASRGGVPFYTGLYGGGEPIGVPASDPVFGVFMQEGYEIQHRIVLLRLPLLYYRPKITPDTARWRLRAKLDYDNHVPSGTWWDALTKSRHHWFQGIAALTSGGGPIARVTLRIPDLAPTYQEMEERLAHADRVADLIHLEVEPEYRGKGLLGYLLGETLRKAVERERVTLAETQITDEFPYLIPFLEKLGWEQSDEGAIFLRKPTDG